MRKIVEYTEPEKFSINLTSADIELVLDHLTKGMTDAKWRSDPERAENVYELYQTIGQALDEDGIVLEFEVTTTKSKGEV